MAVILTNSLLLHHFNINNQKPHNGLNQKFNALFTAGHRCKEGTQLFATQMAACIMVYYAIYMARYRVIRTYLFTI